MISRLLFQASFRAGGGGGLFSTSFKNAGSLVQHHQQQQQEKRGLRIFASDSSSSTISPPKPPPPAPFPPSSIIVTPGVNISPKRGPNAYAIFVSEKYKHLTTTTTSSSSSFSAMLKLIAAEWQKLGDEEKRKYELESVRLQKEYEDAFFSMSAEEFREAVFDEMKRLQKKRVVQLRRQQKQLKETYEYPRADSDYFKVIAAAKDHPTTTKDVDGGKLDAIALAKQRGQIWNNLTETEKAEYEKREQAARSGYKKSVEAWEAQMRKKGLANVVDTIKLRPQKEIQVRLTKRRSSANKKVLASKVSIQKLQQRKAPAATKSLRKKTAAMKKEE